MKIVKHIILFTFGLFLVTSCSDYQQVVRGDDYEIKFNEANRQYERQNYAKAINLYEQVYQRFPRTDKGEVSYYRMAKSFYEERDFYMAGYYFNQFTIRFPTSVKAEEALFMVGMCSVQNSPNYSLDQEETEMALNDLQLFIQRYPNSEYVDSCNRIMDRLRLKIEIKFFEGVKLYDKMEENRAAVASSKAFLEEYPRSNFLQEVVIIQYENSYKLAMNSILSRKKERIEDALDTYSRYKDLITQKKNYAARAEKLNETLSLELKKVDEQYDFNDIVMAYKNSNSNSQQKKVKYLEETITRFNIFATKYPNSEYLEKARTLHKRAEKELSNI